GRRFEEVGATAGAVTDVVADEVRDDRGVARVVLGDTRFDLTDEVRGEVGGFRVDTAPELREEGDERGADAEADDGERRLRGVREAAIRDEDGEDADERERDD